MAKKKTSGKSTVAPESEERRGTEMADERSSGVRSTDDGIDYRAEGSAPPDEHHDSTDEGYDEAVHNGASRYGVPEGRGGVFGTSGGGSYNGGFQVVERPTPYDRSGEPDSREGEGRHSVSRRESEEGFDQVNLDRPKDGKR